MGSVEPFDAFFNIFKVLSKLDIFDFELISIIAEETLSKSNLLSILNLSFEVMKPFSLSFFE